MAEGAAEDGGMKRWVKYVGWGGCAALAAALTYAFVGALASESKPLDPWFFGMQTSASLLFLVYSVRLRNGVFIAANAVALVNAAGTLALALLR